MGFGLARCTLTHPLAPALSRTRARGRLILLARDNSCQQTLEPNGTRAGVDSLAQMVYIGIEHEF